VLCKITGWTLAEVLDMTEQDFYEWHSVAVAVHNEGQ
jgi:hypothetical protein